MRLLAVIMMAVLAVSGCVAPGGGENFTTNATVPENVVENGTALSGQGLAPYGLEGFCPAFADCELAEDRIDLNTCGVSENISGWRIIRVGEMQNRCRAGLAEDGENPDYLYCTFYLGQKYPRGASGKVLADNIILSIYAVFQDGGLVEHRCEYTVNAVGFLGLDISERWIEEEYQPGAAEPPGGILEGGGAPSPLCESYSFLDIGERDGEIIITAVCAGDVFEYVYDSDVLLAGLNVSDYPEAETRVFSMVRDELSDFINRGLYKDAVLAG